MGGPGWSGGPSGSGFNESPGDHGGFHRTLYDPLHDNHISWETDEDDDYVFRTGHEDRDGRKVDDWDNPGG